MESASQGFRRFVSTRGLNLALGFLAFCAVFFGSRLLMLLYRRLTRCRRRRAFASRVLVLAYHLVTIIAAVGAVLVVFNLAGDWFLLGLTLIFLLGVGWATIQTLPQQIDAVRIMLNMGTVREDQRLVWQGVPWKVEALGLSAHLVNPRLSGADVQVPVRSLIGLHSRPAGEHEAWFPTGTGDWVRFADGTVGQVECQSPEEVRLALLGGARRTLPTPVFLEAAPTNLSAGFRIETVFGVDYRHQAEVTSAIPEAFAEALKRRLAGLADAPEQIRDVTVRFQGAADSALEVVALVEADGALADRYERLAQAVAATLVDTCTEKGWGIPFPQLTVHRGGAAST